MKKNHKRTNVPHASGGYGTAGMVTWRHVNLGREPSPVTSFTCVTGVMDSARNRSKKSLENTIKKLSENTEYGIL